jgi:DNA polymerase-3 subunit delta'
VQLEEDKNEIRIEQIRELQKSLSLTPYEAKYRIALIINFHLANPNAQNALLKTLEEAPPKVILLITADAAENLLPTITSRCEILRLRPMPISEMELLLEGNWKVDHKTAVELAHLSSGRIGLAKIYMSEIQTQELIHDLMNDCINVFNFQLIERFQYIEKLTSARRRGETKETVRQLLEIWLLFWRDILLQKSGCSSMITFVMFSAMSRQASSELSFEEINTITKVLEESLSHLEANINIRLLLENLMMKWPAISIR